MKNVRQVLAAYRQNESLTVDQAEAQLSKLYNAVKWMSVDEGLPTRMDVDYLVCVKNKNKEHGIFIQDIANYSADGVWVKQNNWEDVLYWAELPNPPTPLDTISEEEYDDAMDQMLQYEKEISDHNIKVITQIVDEVGPKALKGYEMLLEGACVTNKIQIVGKPNGVNQHEEVDVFVEVWVDQWSVRDSGDSFEGFIYGRFADSKWLKIPYAC